MKICQTFDEIVIKKDAIFNIIICFDIDIEGFFQFAFVYVRKITRPVHLHRNCLLPFLVSTVLFIVGNFFRKKTMLIQIIACWCTELKLREPDVSFYTDTKFYSAVEEVFIAPCKRHLLFKNRFADLRIEMSCKCLLQDAERCTNCKTKCFTLNFLANKLNFHLNRCLTLLN